MKTYQRLMLLLPLALAADLLYLYFSGSWYDPIKWIEYTEVAVLFIICIASPIAFIKSLWC